MAFQTTAVNQNTSAKVVGQNENWKSDAFLNVYIPTRQGGRRKLGTIGLKVSKPMEKQLLDFINEHGDVALAQLKDRIELDFQRADGDNGDELALGIDATA
jgi:hypothetical protein